MTLSANSLAILEGVHPTLVALVTRVHKECGVQIIQGHRSNAQQQVAYSTGKSKAKPGQSAHNSWKARAVDFLPGEFHTSGDWNNLDIFRGTAHVFLGVAHLMNNSGPWIRWGGDWNMNNSEADEHGLRDFDHIELFPWRTYGGVAAVFK